MTEMQSLNLPSFDYKIKQIEDKSLIFDLIRRKYLVLTPEEWVRQHLINLLINVLDYPKTLISVEGGLKYDKLQKRSDILVFDRESKPFLLIECKAPEVKLSQSTVRQASIYNARIGAPHLAISNGLQTFCFDIDHQTQEFSQRTDFPTFP